MTYSSSPNDIMDAQIVADDATTLGAMVPYQKPTAAIEITPQRVYDLLPAEHRSDDVRHKLSRATQADLERAYHHLTVNVTHNNYVEHHHHYESPPQPPQGPIQFVPMPYPVYEPSPQQPFEQQPVVINNYVESSSHGGNAFAHAHAQSEDGDWGGRHVFAAIFCGLAIVALVGAIGGE